MSRFENVLSNLQERRDRVMNGKYNCIPFPFPRFRRIYPGIEKGKYICITSSQKVGKSKFCDFMFIYEPLFFMMEHPEMRMRVIYFTLEMSPEEKYNEFLCHLLYRLDGIRISPSELRSTDSENPVSEKVLDLLQTDRYQKYITAFENMVTYIDDIRNPTGINKYCRAYAEENGHYNYKRGMKKDEFTGNYVEADVIDNNNPYTPNDPEERRVIIIDNASNLINESGMKKMETIDKLSKYGITLRNQLGYIFVLIQHQAQQQEGVENLKLNRIKPTPDGLADCKTTVRDLNTLIGLYNPFKYGIREYEGYDITKFRDKIRFMEIIEDRDYGANTNICPLFFDGATSNFFELPKPDDKTGLDKVYKYIRSLDGSDAVRDAKSYLSYTVSDSVNNIHFKEILSNFMSKFKQKE